MKKQNVEFKVGENTLRGSLFIPDGKGPFPGVVFFHGRGSTRKNYLPMASRLAENGVLTLAFDFRGCGESDGEFENQTHRMGIEDGKAALEFLLSQDVDRNRIGIQGTSFGGFVTGMILNNYDFIKSVVLRVPAVYSDKDLDIKARIEKSRFKSIENWTNISSYKGLEKFKGSLLVIESEKEEVLLPEEVKDYYNVAINAAERKLFTQKNAGHNLNGNPEAKIEFNRITVDWFLETL